MRLTRKVLYLSFLRHLLRDLFPEAFLVYLPHFRHGQVCHEFNPFRKLENRGPLAFQERDDLVECRRETWFRHHKGTGPLAEDLIRHTDDGRVGDGRMRAHQIFDFHGADVLTAPDNDVLYTTSDPDIAGFVLFCLVAGPEKSILCKDLCPLLPGGAKIAGKNAGPLRYELTLCVDGDFPVVLADDFQLIVRADRLTDAAAYEARYCRPAVCLRRYPPPSRSR